MSNKVKAVHYCPRCGMDVITRDWHEYCRQCASYLMSIGWSVDRIVAQVQVKGDIFSPVLPKE